MRNRLILAAVAAVLVAAPVSALALQSGDPIATAVASDQRPAADRERDAARKPAGVLANADDTRTASVFDPSIRARTGQFMLRFRKPE